MDGRRVAALVSLILSAVGCGRTPKATDEPNSHVSVSHDSQPSTTAAVGGTRLILIADLDGTLETCGCIPGSLASLDRLAAGVAAADSGNRMASVIAFGSLYTRQSAAHVQKTDSNADLLTSLLPRMGLDIAAPVAADLREDAQRIQTLRAAGVEVLQPDSARSTLRRTGNVTLGIISAL